MKKISLLIFLAILILLTNFCTKEEEQVDSIIKPTAAFSNDVSNIFKSEEVKFTDKSENTPTSWEWNFGDGTSSNKQHPTHIYDTTGVFSVTLKVSNSGGTDSLSLDDLITVTHDKPTAKFESSHTNIYIDYIVQFSDSSTNVPTSWEWDFGDGNTSTEQNPKHQYTSLGDYSVSLKVSNETGNDTQIKTNLIHVAEAPSSVTDVDGNIYNVVQIGNQIWMKENLKTTHLPDGTAIPLETDYDFWAYLFNNPYEKAYCYPNNNENGEAETYGALYTWHAALNQNKLEATDSTTHIQGVCPDGWHIPSKYEWYRLIRTLGGNAVAGGKLKESGNLHWDDPNTAATNSSGFTALPAGIISSGYFILVGANTHFLSSSVCNVLFCHGEVFCVSLYNSNEEVTISEDGNSPVSVRCIIDE